MQNSIIELQSIPTFLITHFFFVLVPAIAKLIPIKEHSRSFISDKQNGRNHEHRETIFFKSDYVWEYAVPLTFNIFRPKKF